MNPLGKLALGALMVAETAIVPTAPGNAAVAVGIGAGVPYAAPPCSYYNPYYCGYSSYNDPVFVGGTWWYGPHWYRWWGGQPWVWWHGGWHTGFNGGWRGRGWRGGPHPGWHGGWHGWRR